MSKLKKAMEKAKEARATGVSPYPAFRPHVEKGKKASREIDVTYTNTKVLNICLLYTSPSPRDRQRSRMPSSA